MKIDDKIVEMVKNGDIVIFPTDTVYGLGAIPEKKAIEKIYKIKKRDFSKKIIALISDIEILSKIIDEDNLKIEKIKTLMNIYWPGELTIIFKVKKDFIKKIDNDMKTIGVRIPKNEIALDLIRKVGGILFTTSANISGEKSVISIDEMSEKLKKNVDIIIETKEKLSGKPSTIIDFSSDEITIIREGNIKLDDILKIL